MLLFHDTLPYMLLASGQGVRSLSFSNILCLRRWYVVVQAAAAVLVTQRARPSPAHDLAPHTNLRYTTRLLPPLNVLETVSENIAGVVHDLKSTLLHCDKGYLFNILSIGCREIMLLGFSTNRKIRSISLSLHMEQW